MRRFIKDVMKINAEIKSMFFEKKYFLNSFYCKYVYSKRLSLFSILLW